MQEPLQRQSENLWDVQNSQDSTAGAEQSNQWKEGSEQHRRESVWSLHICHDFGTGSVFKEKKRKRMRSCYLSIFRQEHRAENEQQQVEKVLKLATSCRANGGKVLFSAVCLPSPSSYSGIFIFM